jgi:hypothetical protein
MSFAPAIGFGLLIILLIIFAPLAIIWALNTLFALGLAYTFWNWLAVVVLTSAFGKTSVRIKKD